MYGIDSFIYMKFLGFSMISGYIAFEFVAAWWQIIKNYHKLIKPKGHHFWYFFALVIVINIFLVTSIYLTFTIIKQDSFYSLPHLILSPFIYYMYLTILFPDKVQLLNVDLKHHLERIRKPFFTLLIIHISYDIFVGKLLFNIENLSVYTILRVTIAFFALSLLLKKNNSNEIKIPSRADSKDEKLHEKNLV